MKHRELEAGCIQANMEIDALREKLARTSRTENTATANKLLAERDELREMLKKHAVRLHEMTKERDDLARRLASITQALSEVQTELAEAERRAERAEAKVDVRDVGWAGTRIAELKDLLADAERRAENAQRNFKENVRVLAHAQQRAEKAERERDEIRALYNLPGGALEQVEAKNAELRARLLPEEERRKLEGDAMMAETRVTELRAALEDARIGLECARTFISTDHSDEGTAIYEDLEARHDRAERERDERGGALLELAGRFKELEAKNAELRAALEAIRDDPGNTDRESSTDVLIRHVQRAGRALKSDGSALGDVLRAAISYEECPDEVRRHKQLVEAVRRMRKERGDAE